VYGVPLQHLHGPVVSFVLSLRHHVHVHTVLYSVEYRRERDCTYRRERDCTYRRERDCTYRGNEALHPTHRSALRHTVLPSVVYCAVLNGSTPILPYTVRTVLHPDATLSIQSWPQERGVTKRAGGMSTTLHTLHCALPRALLYCLPLLCTIPCCHCRILGDGVIARIEKARTARHSSILYTVRQCKL
jgi:hypothetical protein